MCIFVNKSKQKHTRLMVPWFYSSSTKLLITRWSSLLCSSNQTQRNLAPSEGIWEINCHPHSLTWELPKKKKNRLLKCIVSEFGASFNGSNITPTPTTPSYPKSQRRQQKKLFSWLPHITPNYYSYIWKRSFKNIVSVSWVQPNGFPLYNFMPSESQSGPSYTENELFLHKKYLLHKTLERCKPERGEFWLMFLKVFSSCCVENDRKFKSGNWANS